MVVVHPSYFGPISLFAALARQKEVCLEVCDNYQKQTYRNRCYIYGANGKLLLNIPIVHHKNGKRQHSSEVKIESAFGWQKQHLKSLKTAYQTSPYFEFYEDDITVFFKKDYSDLLSLNKASFKLVLELLDLDLEVLETNSYETSYDQDYRFLINAKTPHPFKIETYTQMFDDKYGFISNLSILDLIFMEGPNTLNFLENQVTKIK